jgi:hypothetical protein
VDIQRLIPTDSLVSCAQNGTTVTQEDWNRDGKIGSTVDALMMNLDNDALEKCTAMANTAFAKVCAGGGSGDGEVSTCDAPFDSNFGAKSLKLVANAGARSIEISGLIDFMQISYTSGEETTENKNSKTVIVNKYPSISTDNILNASVKANVEVLKKELDDIVNKLFMHEPKLAFCTEGRDMSQIVAKPSKANGVAATTLPDRTKTEARFPRLLDPYVSVLVKAGVSKAEVNYDKKLKDLMTSAKNDLNPIAGGIIDGNVCWMQGDAASAASTASTEN